MTRKENSKKSAEKTEKKKLVSKTSGSSKKHSGELNDEQLDHVAGGTGKPFITNG
jgi:hypothetical protein